MNSTPTFALYGTTLRELRAVAEETARTAGPSPGLDGSADATNARASDSSSRRAAVRLEAVRGREVRALERRVEALELERERLAEALRAAASEMGPRGAGATGGGVDAPSAAAAAAALSPSKATARAAAAARELRDANATIDALRSEMKIKDAATAAMRATHAREVQELKATAIGGPPRKEIAGASAPAAATAESTPRSQSSAFARALEAQREDRAVERLTRELFASKATCDALRAQMDAARAEDERAREEADAETDLSADAAAADAACVLAACRALRDAAIRAGDGADDAVRLLPIRPRSRGARHSLRTFPVVTLHPRFPFNV